MTARNSTPGTGKSPATDGGKCNDEPNWENIARREISSNLESMLEMEVYESGYSIVNALGSGEEVEPEKLANVRARFSEFDERVTHALREAGDLDVTSDAEQLEDKRRGVDFHFRRAARSVRKGNLSAHEIKDARESLTRARAVLDELENELEEDDDE